VIPQDGDEAMLVTCTISPTPFEGFGGTWPIW
jgi:hypothetical protein